MMKRRLLIGAFVTTGAIFATLFGKRAFDNLKGGEMEDNTTDRTDNHPFDEELRDAYHTYLEDLDAGYYDRDPRDYD